MSLSIKEQSKQGKDIMDYFESQPAYVQALVTEAITESVNLFVAADYFDENVEDFLENFHPEHLEAYRKEFM